MTNERLDELETINQKSTEISFDEMQELIEACREYRQVIKDSLEILEKSGNCYDPDSSSVYPSPEFSAMVKRLRNAAEGIEEPESDDTHYVLLTIQKPANINDVRYEDGKE